MNPWFWFAALAVAAPVWLHLRRRQERNLVRFSAVRFLEDQPRARSSPFRLQHLCLLLLRGLAVLLIVAAFAWPYRRQFGASATKESVVYILDNTLSHQASEGFNQDRQALIQQIDRAGPEVELAVIELTSMPRVVAGFKDSRLEAKQKVRELSGSYERGSYLAAFRQANALLAASSGRHKRMVLLADNQANQWNEETNTPPFLSDIQLDLPRSSSLKKPNLWLSDLRAHRLFLGSKSTVSFTVRLGHSGPARNAQVVLQVNEQTIFSRKVDLENQPESIVLEGQCEAGPASWIRAQATVEGTPDSLGADNRAFVSVPPVVEGRVALLAQSPYLRLVLSPDIMRGQWSARVLDAGKLPAELAAADDAEVLCLESGYLQNPNARTLVKRYLANGNGVFLIINRLSPAIDGCLRELGFEPEGTVSAEQGHPESFQFVLSNHSIFHPFESSEFGNLMDIRIQGHARLRAKAGRPLIFSQTGDGLFFEGTNHRGKLFVCAFGLDREHSSWPVDPSFIPFIDLTLQAARPQDSTAIDFKPGESSSVPIPLGRSAHTAVLRNGRHEIQRAAIQNGRAQLRMPGTPGLYALTLDDGGSIEKIFSVNPDAKESELEFVESPSAVKGWCLDPAHRTQPVLAAANRQVGFSGILQQRLWWWMVLAGLLALTLETAWAQAKGEAA